MHAVYMKLSWQLNASAWRCAEKLVSSSRTPLEAPPLMSVTLPGTDLYMVCETQMCDSPDASPSAPGASASLFPWLHRDSSLVSGSYEKLSADHQQRVETDWLRLLLPKDFISDPTHPRPLVIQMFAGPSSRLFLGITCLDLAAALTQPCVLHESPVPVLRHGRLSGTMRVSFVAERKPAGRSASADVAVFLRQVEVHKLRATRSCPASPRCTGASAARERATANEGSESDRLARRRSTVAHLRQMGKKLLHVAETTA